MLLAAITISLAQPDPLWDAAFTRTSSWNAGDIAHSIDLGDRTLWLFGDSIVGPVRDGRRIGAESTFVRGAIAWHDTPVVAGAAPDEIQFAIPTPFGDAPVASWTQPPASVFADDAWYWLMGDGDIVANAEGEERFVLFAGVIGPAGAPDGMWNFRQVGGAIITVENPHDAPDQWRAVHVRNTLVNEAARHGEPAVTTEHWGLAVVRWPQECGRDARTTDSDACVYVYGVRSDGPGDNHLLVARCAEDDLDHPDRWTFFDGAGWSANGDDAAIVCRDVQTEFTVERMMIGADSKLVLVQSEPMLGRDILVRTASAPEGPWSEAAHVFTVPEPAEDEKLITYAAKGHVRLSREGELLVSYVVNSTDFWQLYRDASLYRPRFVRIPMDRLP